MDMKRGIGVAGLIISVAIMSAAALTACQPEPVPTASPTVASSSPSGSATPRPTQPPSSASPTEAPTPTSTPPVTPTASVTIITADIYDGNLEVTGIVTGHSDPAAVCTLVAMAGGERLTAEGPVTPNGADSYCPLLTIPASELGSGDVDVTLEYRSDAGAQGVSQATRVAAP